MYLHIPFSCFWTHFVPLVHLVSCWCNPLLIMTLWHAYTYSRGAFSFQRFSCITCLTPEKIIDFLKLRIVVNLYINLGKVNIFIAIKSSHKKALVSVHFWEDSCEDCCRAVLKVVMVVSYIERERDVAHFLLGLFPGNLSFSLLLKWVPLLLCFLTGCHLYIRRL